MAVPSFGPVVRKHTSLFVLLKCYLTFPMHTQPTVSQDVSIDVSETMRGAYVSSLRLIMFSYLWSPDQTVPKKLLALLAEMDSSFRTDVGHFILWEEHGKT